MQSVTLPHRRLRRSSRERLCVPMLVSAELERLHRQETALLRERDELVRVMRVAEVSWSTLSMRTKLSRQALMKRL